MRKTSLNERLYQVGEHIAPPFTLQFIIEGIGQIEFEQLQQCIKGLSEKIPALTAKLKRNRWYFDGELPEVFLHEETFPTNWNAPLFRKKLNAKAGKCAEFHLFSGPNPKLLFRVLHSLMDAKGAQLILRSLFACLRGEPILAVDDFRTDVAVRNRISKHESVKREGYRLKWPSVAITHNVANYQTAVLKFDTRLEAPLAKCASWFAQRFERSCRMLIPVDLRRHDGVGESASNLSLPIYLHINSTQTWQEIQAGLLAKLSDHAELAKERFEQLGLMLNENMLKMLMKYSIAQAKKKELYPMSGILSDNGLLELTDVSSSHFQAVNIISLPVYVPLAPFCVVVMHHTNGSNLAINVPRNVDIESFTDSLQTFIQASEPIKQSIAKPSKQVKNTEEVNALRALWAEVLECEQADIDMESSFHELGGDSLKLLFMLTEVAADYIDGPESSFLNAAMNTAGQMSIHSLMEMLGEYRSDQFEIEA